MVESNLAGQSKSLTKGRTMTNTLDRKIQKIHAALGVMVSDHLTTANVKPQITKTDTGFLFEMNFNQAASEIELENAATLLITNIASIKDHFKVWCENNNVPFKGDELINHNLDVAIIHDLWNIDKHAKLRQPRSGFLPILQELHRGMTLSAQSTVDIPVNFSGQDSEVTTDGSFQFIITGQVVDENGEIRGDFTDICTKAIDSWLDLLKSSGVPNL